MAISALQATPGNGMSLSLLRPPVDVNVGVACVTTPAPAGPLVASPDCAQLCAVAECMSVVAEWRRFQDVMSRGPLPFNTLFRVPRGTWVSASPGFTYSHTGFKGAFAGLAFTCAQRRA